MPQKETANKAQHKPTFEEAMARLESVVEEMESEQLPLETLLARYEEGMKLVGFCTDKLSEAEKRIQIIARSSDSGPVSLEPFEPGEKPVTEAESPGENGEPSLF